MVALVSGDAGMGKTRLVAELATVAAARGFMVLSGRCAELGDSVPYLPLADALHSAAATTPALADAIAARPVLGLLLPDRGATHMAGSEAPGMAQQQLFGAVLGMLAELASKAPVLLVLEDMHWADRSTRDLLTFLSRVLHRERSAQCMSSSPRAVPGPCWRVLRACRVRHRTTAAVPCRVPRCPPYGWRPGRAAAGRGPGTRRSRPPGPGWWRPRCAARSASGRYGTLSPSSAHLPDSTMNPRAAATVASSATSLVLPMPASPLTGPPSAPRQRPGQARG